MVKATRFVFFLMVFVVTCNDGDGVCISVCQGQGCTGGSDAYGGCTTSAIFYEKCDDKVSESDCSDTAGCTASWLDGGICPAAEGNPKRVSFSPGPGRYWDQVSIRLISNKEGQKIYYTLDGSEPNKNSPLYTEEILTATSVTIKAVAIDDNSSSSIEHGAFIINEPYPVATPAELQAIDDDSRAFYELVNDIDLTGIDWVPIRSFRGNFDGNGFTIRNLNMSTDEDGEFGFFAKISGEDRLTTQVITDIRFENAAVSYNGNVVVYPMGILAGSINDATIKKIVADNSNVITGKGHIGGLVGEAFNTVFYDVQAAVSVTSETFAGGIVAVITDGKIEQSSTSGFLVGDNVVGGLAGRTKGTLITQSYSSANIDASGIAGGLVGDNDGLIEQSYATGNVSGDSVIGGLTGYNIDTVTDCFATGDVTGSSYDIGGLVANNVGSISNSWAAGVVNGDGNTGGLVGRTSGSISRSYAIGQVVGSSDTGGLTGAVFASGSIRNSFAIGSVNGSGRPAGLTSVNAGVIVNSYAAGEVTGSFEPRGLVGDNFGTVTGSVWDTDTSGQASSEGGTGYSTGAMITFSTYTSNGFDSIDWAILPSINGGYPILMVFYDESTGIWKYEAGKSCGQPYLVALGPKLGC